MLASPVRLSFFAAAALLLAFSGAASPPASARTLAPAITVRDIGALPGNFGSCSGVAINASGQIVGSADMPGGNRHAFRWTAGTMADLGTLGGTFSSAAAVNSLGHVAGSSTIDSADEVNHAFFWDGSTMVDLGTLPGQTDSHYTATAINASDVVVGYAMSADYTRLTPFRWTAAGGIKALPTLGGDAAAVYAVNGSGVMVGYSMTLAGAFRPVMWSAAGRITELPGGDGSASKINDSGVIAGDSDPGIGTSQAAVWIKGKIKYLGSLTGPLNSSRVADLNSKGHVVGTSGVSYPLTQRAFLWTPETGMRDLGALRGYNSEAFALNDSDVVVGTSETADANGQYDPTFPYPWLAFVWDATHGMRSLGTFAFSTYGVGINNAGQMIGTGESLMGTRTFVTTTPGTLTDIGGLSGGRSAALAINTLGEVVGESVGDDRLIHAFFWSDSTGMLDLGTEGLRHARAIDINDSGEVIVQTGTQLPDGERPFYWSRATRTRTAIPGLGGFRWEVTDINNRGQVAGNSFLANGEFHAMLWTKAGGTIDIDGVAGSYSFATSINDDGTVVGWRGPAGTGILKAFQWKAGVGMKDLPTFGGDMTMAWKINNRGDIAGVGFDQFFSGQAFLYKGNLTGLGSLGTGDILVRGLNANRLVVGRAWSIDAGAYRAFAGSSAPLRDLGTLPDHGFSEARAVNDAGDIVGVSGARDADDPAWRAFLVRGSGAMVELTTPSGGFSEAAAINLSGKVVGTLTTLAGTRLAAVWTTQ